MLYAQKFSLLKIHLFIILSTFNFTSASAQQYSHQSYKKIQFELSKIANNNLKTVKKRSLGLSPLGSDITYLSVSPNKNKKYAKQILFLGGIHGDEPLAVEIVLGLARLWAKMPKEYSLKLEANGIVMLFLPLFNPDGFINRNRLNSQGVDLNRNFYIQKTSNVKNKLAPENKLLAQLFERNNILGLLSFHAGDKAIYWPYCYTRLAPKHHKFFKDIAQKMAKFLHHTKFKQSFFDYPSQGELIDFAYNIHSSFSYTIELHRQRNLAQSKIPALLRESFLASKIFVESLISRERGLVL